jgi:hypothetical protein
MQFFIIPPHDLDPGVAKRDDWLDNIRPIPYAQDGVWCQLLLPGDQLMNSLNGRICAIPKIEIFAQN